MSSNRFRRAICQTSPEPIGLVIERAEGIHVYTTDGRAYLDLTAGIGVANVGHARDEVTRAVTEQLARHAHVMVYGEYEQQAQTDLAERVGSLLPDPISQVFLASSGTEAVEGALKTARKFTGRAGFIAFDGSYHGDTMGSLSVQANARYRAPFEPLIEPVRFLPFGDADALDVIDTSTAAVIIEPVQGEGGIRVPPDGFLQALRARCDDVGALLVFDEVITGFGRTGCVFAMERFGVTPDLVCLAKAMGGGLPLGGFAGSEKIMRTLAHDPPLCHVTTFGGNPVSCAAGLAGLRILIDEKLAENAERVGAFFRERLDELVGLGGVVEARGIGLMLGLVFDSSTATRRFVERSLEEGLLLGWTLHCDDVIRITPPLIITRDAVDDAVARMRAALG